MADAAPLQLPGYVWDPATRRYFKASTSAGRQTPASAARTAQLATERAQANEEKLRKTKRERKRQGEGRRAWKGDETGSRDGTAAFAALRNSHLGPWILQPAKREAYKHDLQACHLGQKLRLARTLYPDCLPMDDSIQHLSFDQGNPTRMRVGTANGTIATGVMARPPDELDMYPHDEEGWRTSWMCSSKITSLRTSRDRAVATCLGPPAQAIISTTNENISLASVTLSPRKTSLWSSAISSDLVALGGDRSVLLCPLASLSSNSTSSPESNGGGMDAYVTGGRGGGGTVFALEVDEPGRMVWAGVRRGDVKGFDWRSGRRNGASGGAQEVNFRLSTPITHLRLIPGQPHQLLAASMGGELALYDLRFLRPERQALPAPAPPSHQSHRPSQKRPRNESNPPGHAGNGVVEAAVAGPSPVLRIEGHVNSFSTELGLDVWKDEWVAVAGQDCRLRIFSLRTGLALPALPKSLSSSSGTSTTPTPAQNPALEPADHPLLLSRRFPSPIKSVAFSPLDPSRLREATYTRAVLEREEGSDLRAAWDAPSVWVADGPAVRCYGLP